METNLEQKIKKDLAIMKVLKSKELHYHIGKTDRGASIDLVITKDNPEYQFFVDAGPLEKEENEVMLKLFNLK